MKVWDAQAETMADARRAVWADDRWDDGILHCAARIMSRLGVGRGDVLDFGCGMGRLLEPLSRVTPWTLTGMDISVRMLDHAHEHVGRESGVRFYHGGVKQITDSGSYDGIYSVLVFQHLDPFDQAEFFHQLAMALKVGARAVIQFVQEGEHGPLNHPVPLIDFERHALHNGLSVFDVSHGDTMFPTWTWATLQRPTTEERV